jgi:hypothetical protein
MSSWAGAGHAAGGTEHQRVAAQTSNLMAATSRADMHTRGKSVPKINHNQRRPAAGGANPEEKTRCHVKG